MSGLDSCFASGQEEFLNSRVPKALDHPLSVAHHAHAVKAHSTILPEIRKDTLVEVHRLPHLKVEMWATQI